MFLSKFKSPLSGFTLIEILVAISLTLTVSYFGIAYFSGFNRRQVVDQAAKKIVSDLRLAQNLAMTQQKPESSLCLCTGLDGNIFSVSEDKYSLLPNCFPACSTAVKEVSTAAVSLTGLTAVEFKILTGGLVFTNGSTLTVSSLDAGYSRQILIGEGGEITIN